MLIEILGADVSARSRFVDGSGTVLSDIEPAFLRSAPVYHVVEAGPDPGLQLEIQVQQATKQGALTVNWYSLSANSRQHVKLADAWRDLANGLQFVQGEDPEDWAQNLHALQRAADAFARIGLTEQALWARYFRAYAEYYPLYRYSEALAGSEKVIEEARRRDFRTLEMLGHQLAGQILVEREAGIDEAQARRDYEAAQDHFAQALRMARESGNGFETVWSINNTGIASKYQDDPQRAFGEYGQALDLAIELEDNYLINLIGGNMAVAQESLGEIRQAIQTLERIENELSPIDEPADLEHIRSLLGGYYLKLYEFPSALDKVTEALELSQQLDIAESLGRNHLLLGQIYRELGQAEKSRLNVELAIPHLEESRNGRGLKRAYGLAADLYRGQELFADMQAARSRQEQYLANDADRALWAWSSAHDALEQGDNESALPLFESSAMQFASTSLGYLGELATLHACVLKSADGTSASCTAASVEESTRPLRTHQASIFQLEGRYLWARLLALEGQTATAHAEMDQLIADISFFRGALPGVLGAWYWDARTALFDFYLELTIAAAVNEEDAAIQSLQALDRLRNLGLRGGFRRTDANDMGVAAERSGRLRELIALRDRAHSLGELEQSQREIDLALLEQGPSAIELGPEPDWFELRTALKALPEDWSLLTFHLGRNKALAWIGDKDNLQLLELGPGDELRTLLKGARQEIRTVNSAYINQLLGELGERFIRPVSHLLRHNILFLGAGAFSYFPLEALVLDGEYVLTRHRVYNVLSLWNLLQTVSTLDTKFLPQRIYLAGAPEGNSAVLQALPGSMNELRAVSENFPEAVSQIFFGPELIHGAFKNSSLEIADIIHIASHASIDIEYPELSRIELSDGYLTPVDLSGLKLSAELVVLSACNTAGFSRFEFDTQLGFVTEFLSANASQVLATLWPISDSASSKMIAIFYDELAETGSVAEALRTAKMKSIDDSHADIVQSVAFQYYAR